MSRSLSCVAALMLASAVSAQGVQMPLPAYTNTYSSSAGTRGFWFQAPIPFLITGLRVPDEQASGIQNVEVFIMSSPPPLFSQSATGGQVFYATNVPSAQVIPTSISVQPGDYVGVLGACGTTTMYNSYAPSPATSDVLGTPVTLTRFLTQTNLNTSGGNQPYSTENGGSIARVEVYCAPLQSPYAHFVADDATPTIGQTVQFTDRSYTSDPMGILVWQWDLDGNPTTIESSLQNPSYTYTACGAYDITLTVLDAVNSHTTTKTNYINVQNLSSSFTADKTEAGPGEIVTFTDTSTTSDPGGIVGWGWDFDGDSAIDATTQTATWAFITCGPQDVTLYVADATCTQTHIEQDVVDIVAPVADFLALAGPAPVTAQFTDASSHLPTQWAWDFDGDNMIDSTLQNPTWAYATQGVFQVSLTATNSCGSDTFTVAVDTRSTLCTDFAAADRTLAQGGGLFFDASVMNPQGVTVTSIDLNSSSAAGQVVAIDVYLRLNGSHVGTDGSAAGWTLVSAGSRAFSAGPGNPTTINVRDFCLPPGSHALFVVGTAGGQRFFDGDGATGPGSNTYYANTDLAIQAGVARSGRFSGTRTPQAVWSGCLSYSVGATTPGSISQIGSGCAGSSGSTPSFGTRGGQVPLIGSRVTFEVASAPPSTALSFIMIGFVSLGGIDLGVIGMAGCPLYVDPLVNFNSPTDAAGAASASLTIENVSTTVGLTFYGQAFIADPLANPFGAILSDAISGTIGGC